MKILITGGAGFIASHIADRYLELGHQVVIVDDLSSGSKNNIPEKAVFYKESILSPKMTKIFEKEKPDIVNHHAAQVDLRKAMIDPIFDASINIMGGLNILEACRHHTVKKFILASSGGAAYGDQNVFPADENHIIAPKNPYGITKVTLERYLNFYQQAHALKTVILRYANIYGPRQGVMGDAGVVAMFIKKILKKEPPLIFGNGEQTRDFVYIDDVVHCNVAALASNITGTFHVATGRETTVNKLTETLLHISRSSLKPQHVTQIPGEQKRSCLKPGKLQKIPPTSLEKGLKKTWEWFLEE